MGTSGLIRNVLGVWFLTWTFLTDSLVHIYQKEIHGDKNYKSKHTFIDTLTGDLKTRESTGTSCHIEIIFSIQTTKLLAKYNLLSFQISCRLRIYFTKHNCKVSTSFMKENKRYKLLKIWKWISIRLLQGFYSRCHQLAISPFFV